nr:O-antigen ligase family protein [Candidatus Hamiltonella defensa]
MIFSAPFLNYFTPQHRFTTFATVIAFLLGFSLPTSNVLMHFLLVLALLCVFLRPNRHFIKILAKNPLVWLPAVLFLLLLLSLLTQYDVYGVKMIYKYKKLLFILPLSLFFLMSRSLSKQFVKGFLLANAIILFTSFLIWEFDLPLGTAYLSNPTVFKMHITQNFFMALAVLIWLQQTFHHKGIKFGGYALLTCLGVYNIFFMVQGRTGYLALVVAFFTWIFLSCSKVHQLRMIIVALILGAVLVIVPNKANVRMHTAIKQIQTCLAASQPNLLEACGTSMGLRTMFALRSWQLIKEAPILGHGAGSFEHVSKQGNFIIHNPHNEYLIQTLQSGLLGLTVFLVWMWCFFRSACQQPSEIKNMFIAVLMSYMACHFFNSFLLDSSEGHLFVILTAILASRSVHFKTPHHNQKNVDIGIH